jgi:4-hydroxy 2-oxovalerate aldolase
MTTILDCTLRDGGYYTKWDFNKDLVDQYINTVSNLPIDYVEIGYRSPVKKEYYGEYFYLPTSTIVRIRKKLNKNKKIAVMINTKDCRDEKHLEELLLDCNGLVDMVRFAVSPNSIIHAVRLGKKAKELGFELALNIMYLSKSSVEELEGFVNQIIEEIPSIDFIYFVDSFGACFPNEIREKFEKSAERFPDIKFGFHGHDNIQLAYANTIVSMESGARIVDSTITGMGRGAGNLSTELICSHFNSKNNFTFDYTDLVDLVERFTTLKNEYSWGTSLPYMISGLEQLPQGEIMNLVSMKRYSTNSIIKMIKKNTTYTTNEQINKSQVLTKDNLSGNLDLVVLIGGGNTVSQHAHALVELGQKFNTLFIHSSLKNYKYTNIPGFNNLVCLPGDEYKKIDGMDAGETQYALSPKVNISQLIGKGNVYYLGETDIDKLFDESNTVEDAPLLMALKAARHSSAQNYFLIGFDGYGDDNIAHKMLREENQIIIDKYNQYNDLISLTETKYSLKVKSLYGLLYEGIINE